MISQPFQIIVFLCPWSSNGGSRSSTHIQYLRLYQWLSIPVGYTKQRSADFGRSNALLSYIARTAQEPTVVTQRVRAALRSVADMHISAVQSVVQAKSVATDDDQVQGEGRSYFQIWLTCIERSLCCATATSARPESQSLEGALARQAEFGATLHPLGRPRH